MGYKPPDSVDQGNEDILLSMCYCPREGKGRQGFWKKNRDSAYNSAAPCEQVIGADVQLSVVSCQLSVVSVQLSAFSCQRSVVR